MEEQEKELSMFSKLAAWTEYELADLCLGLIPDRGRADNEERNRVLEFIHRAAEMGELPRKTNSLQPLNLHQYRTSTYYPRSDATYWAAANFPETFPFTPESGGTTGQEEKPRLTAAGGYPVAPEGLQVGGGDGGEDKPLASRAETTYLNIIGGLLALMLGKSPAGNPQSVFDNQAAIISALLGHHADKPGIAQRTLEEKFAAAKRSLTGS